MCLVKDDVRKSETWNGKSTETDGQNESSNRDSSVPRIRNDHKEYGFHSESTAVEDLPHGCGGENAVAAEMVGELTADRHHDRHDEMRQSRQSSHFTDLKVKDFLEIHGLRDDEQIECPRPAEIRHDDGVNWHGSEEALPRRRPEVWDGALDVAQRFLNVHPLRSRDGRM